MYDYKATVVRWIDGDTVLLDADLGFHIWLKKLDIRLFGVNTPEKTDPVGWQKAVDFVNQLAPVGTVLTLTSKKALTPLTPDKYGDRWDGVLTLADGRIVSDEIIKAGVGVYYAP